MVQGFVAGRIGRRSIIAGAGLLAAPAVPRARATGRKPAGHAGLLLPARRVTDISARLVAPGLAEILGKPVVIENRAGAGGNIGIGYVARSCGGWLHAALASSVFVVNPSLYRNAPYDPFRDFAAGRHARRLAQPDLRAGRQRHHLAASS